MSRELFEKNLAAYRARFGQGLRVMVDAVAAAAQGPRSFEIVLGKKGHPTLRATAPDGGLLHIHSIMDPETEARRRLDKLNLKSDSILFLVGIGLGYHLFEIQRRPEKPCLIMALEPEPEALAVAFETYDFTEILADPVFFILTGRDMEMFHAELTSVFVKYGGRDIVMETLPHVQSDMTFIQTCLSVFNSTMKTASIAVRTTRMFHEATRLNIVSNFDRLALSADPDALAGLFRNRPGVLVGPAPSLEKQKGFLRALSRRCVVIALGSALRILKNAGVRPHIAVFMDPQNKTLWQIRQLSLDSIICVAPDSCHPAVINAFGDRVLLVPEQNSPVAAEFQARLGRYGHISMDITVALFALHLVKHLGIKPLALLGIDFLIKGNERYASGAQCGFTIRDSYIRDHVLTVWNTFGSAQADLLHYRKSFRDLVRHIELPVVDVRETGAFIEGLPRMSMKEFLVTLPAERSAVDPTARLMELIHESNPKRRRAKVEVGRMFADSLDDIETLLRRARAPFGAIDAWHLAPLADPDVLSAGVAEIDTALAAASNQIAWPLVAEQKSWEALMDIIRKTHSPGPAPQISHDEINARREFIESHLALTEKMRPVFMNTLERL
jgi:hypothetical protein